MDLKQLEPVTFITMGLHLDPEDVSIVATEIVFGVTTHIIISMLPPLYTLPPGKDLEMLLVTMEIMGMNLELETSIMAIEGLLWMTFSLSLPRISSILEIRVSDLFKRFATRT